MFGCVLGILRGGSLTQIRYSVVCPPTILMVDLMAWPYAFHVESDKHMKVVPLTHDLGFEIPLAVQ